MTDPGVASIAADDCLQREDYHYHPKHDVLKQVEHHVELAGVEIVFIPEMFG